MLTKEANAKINLTLDVVSKRADGYHMIETVMQSISLHDVIFAEKAESIELSCDAAGVPVNEKNTCYKAAKLFFEASGISGGVKIKIKKNIPSEAGLGGGSSDAAAALLLLNELYDAKLSYEALENIAEKVGADVPFLVRGGTAVCKGIGEKITHIGGLEKRYVLLVKPDFGILTPEAYRLFDEKGLQSRRGTDDFQKAHERGENPYMRLSNDLEKAIENADIAEIKTELVKSGAEAAQMTGSGSCVFGLFTEKKTAEQAQRIFQGKYPFCALCETI